MIEKDSQFAEAELWANLDGCEPGDLLRMIIQAAERSQDGYGYAMSDETEGFLRKALQAEMDAHEDWVKNEGSYQDPEYEAEVLDAIKRLRAKRD